MTNFSVNPAMVRGDLFTDTGKWKYTVQIDMNNYYHLPFVQDAVRNAYTSTPAEIRGTRDGVKGMWLIVLEPYHKNPYPVATRL